MDMANNEAKLNVLVLESDELYLAPLRACLAEQPEVVSLWTVGDATEAKRLLAEETVHALYVDVRKALTFSDATDFIDFVRRTHPHVVFVLYGLSRRFLRN